MDYFRLVRVGNCGSNARDLHNVFERHLLLRYLFEIWSAHRLESLRAEEGVCGEVSFSRPLEKSGKGNTARCDAFFSERKVMKQPGTVLDSQPIESTFLKSQKAYLEQAHLENSSFLIPLDPQTKGVLPELRY